MYKKILVAMALDHGISERALDTARKLLNDGGNIVAIHVLEQIPGYLKNSLPEGQEEENHKETMRRLKERIGDASNAEPAVIVGHAGPDIVKYANNNDAECIIVGSHKPTLADFLIGSTAAHVARHANCSVHVIR